MNTNTDSWVGNLYQRIETVCIDGLVNKDPVLYVGNQIQTVGESVKKFYSDVVQDILPPLVDPIQHAAQSIPSKCVNLVENAISSLVDIKENTVDSNTNEPKEPTDLDFDIDKKIEGEPLMNLEEKKTLMNGPVNEFDCDSNTSTIHQSSESESLVICNENKKENANQISFTDSSNSLFRNFIVESNKIDHKPSEKEEYFSASSLVLSSCGSFTALGCDINNEVSASCSGTDVSIVDFEDVELDTIDLSDKKQLGESCVMVEGGKLVAFPEMSRRKSYKKMIQDAFMSRRRLTKEYRQLSILYGDIDKEFSQPTEMNKLSDIGITSMLPAQDLADSEWELL